MKIKTIEKTISIRYLSHIFKSIIFPNFQIKSSNFIKENILFLIASDNDSRILQLGAFNDLEFNRTIISICMLRVKQLPIPNKGLKTSDVEYECSDKQYFFQLIDPVDATKYSKNMKIEFNELEGNLLKEILIEIQNKFDYKDKILKYPFSLIKNFDIDDNWYISYGNYLDLIERNLIKYGINRSQIFRYYDFAKKSEPYQRIIDLVVISDKIIIETEEHSHWMLFVYSNKGQNPLKVLEVVKLFGEISQYSKLLQKKLKGKIIQVALFVLSQKGFDKTLSDYLRNHIYGESEYIVPIFLIPPHNQSIWHNLNDDQLLPIDLSLKKNQIKSSIAMLRNVSNNGSYHKNQIESELKILSDIEDRINNVEKNHDLINIFSKILSIENSQEFFRIDSEKQVI